MREIRALTQNADQAPSGAPKRTGARPPVLAWVLTLRNHLNRCQWLSTAYQALARDAMPLKHKQQLQQQIKDTSRKTVQYLKWLQLNPRAIFQGLQPNDLFESGSRIAPVDNKRILATLTDPNASHLQLAAVLHKGAQQYSELFKQQAGRIRAQRANAVQKPDMRSACSQLKCKSVPPLLRARTAGQKWYHYYIH